MPVNKAFPLNTLMSAIRNYEKVTSRRVTFEYIMLKGVNDSIDDAKKLAKDIDLAFTRTKIILESEDLTRFNPKAQEALTKHIGYLEQILDNPEEIERIAKKYNLTH